MARLLVIAKVDNAGPPSTAWDWKAHVELPGGAKMTAGIPAVSILTNSLPIPTIIGEYQPRNENNLLQLLALTQLEQGGSKIGWLMIHLPDITELPTNSMIHISFANVFGRETKAAHFWSLGK